MLFRHNHLRGFMPTGIAMAVRPCMGVGGEKYEGFQIIQLNATF